MNTHVPALNTADLYRRYAPMVLRRVRCFYRGPDAEEVLHEIFMKLLERTSTFEGRSQVVTWLYRITTNHCIDRLRTTKRRSQLLEQHARDFDPGTEQARQEQRAFLNQLFDALDDDLARIGVLYFVDGMTHAEIGRVLDCSPRTVGNRLETLQVTLRARLERENRG